MVAASETPKAKKQRIQNQMVAMTKKIGGGRFFKGALSHRDFCFMLGDAIDAISSGEHNAREWTSHPCDNGDVFSLGYLGVTWLLELGPEAKGNKMKGCAGKSNASVNSWGAQASNWQRWKHVDAKGGEAHVKGTGKI